MTPQLTVAVLTYNGEQLLPDCLTSIFQQTFPVSTELLILDNGSEEPVSWPMPCTPTSHPKNLEMVRIERVEPNCGNIGGQNRCFEQARGEWVLFVANDVRLQIDCIKHLWEWKEEPFQIQPICLKKNGSVDQAGMCWKWPGYGISITKPHSITYDVSIVPSTCYLMNKSLWRKHSGFDESLLSSHEDVDFGLRTNGGSVIVNATVIHLGNATLKRTLPNHRAAFHRARWMVIRKHYRGIDQWTRLGAEWAIYHLCFLFGMKQ